MHLEQLRGRRVVRFLDAVFLSKDEAGALRADPVGVDLIAGYRSGASESLLWQLLGGNGDEDDEFSSVASFELRSAREVGLDLAALENITNLIDPGMSALFLLVEPQWEGALLDAVITAEGCPLVFACLESETMLVMGSRLARAVDAADVAERTAAIRGTAMLDSLAAAEGSATVAEVVSALVHGGVIHVCDVGAAMGVLTSAGVIPLTTLQRATSRADVAVAEDARAGALRLGPGRRSSPQH